MTDGELVISESDSAIDDLEQLAPLWSQMQLHQIEVADHQRLNADLDLGWGIRRTWYAEELAKGGFIARAARDGRLVGYCAVSMQLHPDETFSSATMATIITLSVDASERGHGVGTALLTAAEASARSRGADTIALEVMPGNDRARALYERMGFEPVEVRMHRSIMAQD